MKCKNIEICAANKICTQNGRALKLIEKKRPPLKSEIIRNFARPEMDELQTDGRQSW